jgi:hypothetical protein
MTSTIRSLLERKCARNLEKKIRERKIETQRETMESDNNNEITTTSKNRKHVRAVDVTIDIDCLSFRTNTTNVRNHPWRNLLRVDALDDREPGAE